MTNKRRAPKQPQQIDLQEEDLKYVTCGSKNHLELKSLRYILSRHDIVTGIATDSQL
jgi:hypothetical protein